MATLGITSTYLGNQLQLNGEAASYLGRGCLFLAVIDHPHASVVIPRYASTLGRRLVMA